MATVALRWGDEKSPDSVKFPRCLEPMARRRTIVTFLRSLNSPMHDQIISSRNEPQMAQSARLIIINPELAKAVPECLIVLLVVFVSSVILVALQDGVTEILTHSTFQSFIELGLCSQTDLLRTRGPLMIARKNVFLDVQIRPS